MQRVNDIAQHVRHDHLKGVLIAQRGRKEHLVVDRNATTSSNTVGDGVNDLPTAVPDTNLDVQVLEESVGQDAVVDLHRIV